jgi:hypothetical protein
VDWSFYEQLVDSIPESSNIHVDYDGKDLEIMGKGAKHEDRSRLLGLFVSVVGSELAIPYKGLGETTWKRPQIHRGLESDQCFYFQPEKLAGVRAANRSGNLALYPNPDLAVEVDVSRPQVDRAGIYSALGVYAPVDESALLPVRIEDLRRWILEEDSTDEGAWVRRLREEVKKKARRSSRQSRRPGGAK